MNQIPSCRAQFEIDRVISSATELIYGQAVQRNVANIQRYFHQVHVYKKINANYCLMFFMHATFDENY